MTIVPVLKQALKIAGRIDRKYNINKIFIDKHVPPHLRSPARKLVDIAGTLGGGYGIVRFVESLYAADTPGNGATIPFKRTKQYTSRKSYQTRSGRTRRRGFGCPKPTKSDYYSRRSSYR